MNGSNQMHYHLNCKLVIPWILWSKPHTANPSNEMSLRLPDNIVLEDGTATLSLRDFIKHYSAPGKQFLTPSNLPTHFKHMVKSQRLPWMMLEGFVHIELVCHPYLCCWSYHWHNMWVKYEKCYRHERQAGQENYESVMIIGKSGRRRHRSESITPMSQLTKRARTTSGMYNTFVIISSGPELL